VKAAFAGASIVGDCIVFNIGGNKYRLVTRIRYPSQKVFILKVMTHSEYDKDKWKDECGCFDAPPQKKQKQARPVARKPKGR
jgi:mRNA interferase HigB